MRQSIPFIGTDFDQYLRLKTTFSEFACTYSVCLPEGVNQFNQQEFCLIILNLSLILSDTGQEELLRSFRRAHPVPIIALRANIIDSDVVRLLAAGADQVLPAPASDEILAAYTHTLINRYTFLDRMDRAQCNRIELWAGDFMIDLIRRQVFIKDQKIELSGKEFELLVFFARNPKRVLTEAQIFEGVWKSDKDFHSSIAKPINRLRQKIEPDIGEPAYIRSVRGVGYQFMPEIVKSCDI